MLPALVLVLTFAGPCVARAATLSLGASRGSVEPGDTIALTLKGHQGPPCALVLVADGTTKPIRGTIKVTARLRVTSRWTPGPYKATATCGRHRVQAHFLVHALAGPDFSMTLGPTRSRGRTGGSPTRVYAIRALNTAPWAARAARLCISVSGGKARITGVTAPGSLVTSTSACAIMARIPSTNSQGFRIRVSTSKPLGLQNQMRVSAAISAANSKPLFRSWSVGASIRATMPSRKGSTAGAESGIKRPDPANPAATLGAGPDRVAKAGSLSRSDSGTLAPFERSARAEQAICTTPKKVGVAFIADDSGSMISNDPGNLRGTAIGVGVDQLPDGSLVGATRFADYSVEMFGVQEVNDTTRPSMRSVAVSSLASDGNTDYQEAFAGAEAQLSQMTNADRKAVIFLSDGAPSYDGYTADQAIASQGIPIYTIGFGDADESVLSAIAGSSGGQTFQATSADDLQSIFARIVSALTCSAPSISTSVDLAPGQSQTVPFLISPADGEFQALASWSGSHVTVTATRPDGSTMTSTSLRSGERFSDSPTYALLRAADPAVGGWVLTLTSDSGNASNIHVSVDIFNKKIQASTPPPIDRATQGRNQDVCGSVYGSPTSRTKSVLGGHQTDYNRNSSLYLICAGFGAPENLEFSLGMRCAFVSAATILAGGELADPALKAFDAVCAGTDTLLSLEKGEWGSVVAGQACNWFGSVFSEGTALVAAGLAAETGPGALLAHTFVYRSFAAGFKIACGGLFSGGAADFGRWREAGHDTDVAADVLNKGECIRESVKFGWTSWSAAPCA